MNIPAIPEGTSKADAALIYAREGIPVFPCGDNKAPIGRLVPNGFLDQTTDEDTIRKWWDEYPDANPASAFDEHTLVLDVDDPQKWTEGGIDLPRSGPVQTTANYSPDNPRRQYIFNINGADPKGLITTLPTLGAETKGMNKGYVLLPPSTALRKDRVTMGEYRWARTGPTDPLPQAVEAAVRTRGRKDAPKPPKPPSEASITVTGGPCAKWCDATGPIPRDPGGYQYLNDYAFHRVKFHRDTQRPVIEDQLLQLLFRMDPPYEGIKGTAVVGKVMAQVMTEIASGSLEPDGPSQWQQSGEDNEPDPDDIDTLLASLRVDASAAKRPDNADDWLIDGLIRPGSITVLASVEGLGKSVLRRELAVRLALGRGDFLAAYAIPKAGKVVLVDEENGEAIEWDGETDVLTALRVDRTDLAGNLVRFSFPGVGLTSKVGRALLTRMCEQEKPDVVELDTASLMVAVEWGEELKEAVKFLRSLARDFGTAFLLVVHMVKPPRDGNPEGTRAITDVMGQWSRHVDVVLTMSPKDGGRRAQLRVSKRVKQHVYILEQQQGLWVKVGEVVAPTVTIDVSMPQDRAAKVLRDIRDGVNPKDQWEERYGVGKTVYYEDLKRLVAGGYLTRERQGHALTLKGDAHLVALDQPPDDPEIGPDSTLP